MKSTCETMFVRVQGSKGIAYRFFSLSDGQTFSMSIDASNYPKECWNSYHDAVECFINSLTDSLKNQFWLRHKYSHGFVDWHKVIKLNLNVSDVTKFDSQFINDFINDSFDAVNLTKLHFVWSFKLLLSAYSWL